MRRAILRGRGRATWSGLLGFALVVSGGRAVDGQDVPRRGHPVAPEGAAAVSVAAAGGAPAGSLAAVLARCSPDWAVNGLIRRERLQQLASDPRIRGDRAIALATLIHHFGKDAPDSFRADEFDALPDRKGLDRTYKAMAAEAAEVRPALFAEGRPNFDRIRQGHVGDCYFLSGVGWVARYHPDRIVRAIRPLPGGGFEVAFPSGERAIVAPLTEAEVLISAAKGTLADGLWVATLEKALGVIEAEHSRHRAAIADPILRIRGGSIEEDIRRWTGHPAETLRFDHPDEVRRLHHALLAMQERRLMAQASISQDHAPNGLPHKHAYAILGYDPAREVVTIWNPWGDDFTPKGPPGPEHGWPRHHGVFEVPRRDFVRCFSRISIEHRP